MKPTHSLKQKPGDLRCIAIVAALITGKPPEDFEAFCGSPAPYTEFQLYHYLLSHGVCLGGGFTPQARLENKPVETLGFEIKLPLVGSPAVVIVNSATEGMGHAVYWDGGQIWDPSPSVENGLHPSTYDIRSWTPICRIDTH